MTERVRFEVWWDSDFRPQDDPKLYEAAWNVWQAALAQRTEQEPVACLHDWAFDVSGNWYCRKCGANGGRGTAPLYERTGQEPIWLLRRIGDPGVFEQVKPEHAAEVEVDAVAYYAASVLDDEGLRLLLEAIPAVESANEAADERGRTDHWSPLLAAIGAYVAKHTKAA